MNQDGLGITIRHTLHEEVEKFCKYQWRCVACGDDLSSVNVERFLLAVTAAETVRGPLREVILSRQEGVERLSSKSVLSMPSTVLQPKPV